jgi:hypothetical protein
MRASTDSYTYAGFRWFSNCQVYERVDRDSRPFREEAIGGLRSEVGEMSP